MSLKEKIKKFKYIYIIAKIVYSPIKKAIIFTEKRKQSKLINLYKNIQQLSQNSNINMEISKDNIIVKINDGRKFYYYPNKSNSLLGVAFYGKYEIEETELANQIIDEGDTIIDIGANFGWFTTMFAKKVGEKGKIHSFEPIKTTFEELSNNVKINDSNNNIILNNCALGESEGTIKMYLPKELGSAWASRSSHGNTNCSEYECEMKKLDDYVKQMNIEEIKLIKCDVEGAELQVLKGAKTILESKNSPILIMEVEKRWTKDFGYLPKDLFEYVYEYGYKIYYLKDSRLIELNDFNNLINYNFVFLKNEKHYKLLTKYFE